MVPTPLSGIARLVPEAGSRVILPEFLDGEPSRRDELISLARYGLVTPEQAEAEAKAAGFQPFERQPELPSFDPLAEPRWTIVQALAWIAWRDLDRVRENGQEFTNECTHWLFREWNEAVANGTRFERRAGWFLESWCEPTTARLQLLEVWHRTHNTLSNSLKMSVREAQQALWRALSDEHLVAEGLDIEDRPTDIPSREWSYLKLYEDGKKDVLRYDASDRREPFKNVKLRRDDLLRLWPPVPKQADFNPGSGFIEEEMLEPMRRPGTAGYVPLCVVLHWIMTRSGTARTRLDDEEKWKAAIDKLRPLLADGTIEVIGIRGHGGLSETVANVAFAVVRIPSPAHVHPANILLNAPPHIDCSIYSDEATWTTSANDRLFVSGAAAPEWTHLQARKSDILERWPEPPSVMKAESACCRWLASRMAEAPAARPKSKDAFWEEARGLFAPLARRQFERSWDRAIAETGATNWQKAGRPKA